ncbi:GGDEF domain-containing protein [Vibrio sp. SCSIO 43137]|uniref:GGDEF domain-containing protein n=1 Tax=Vibrio sp. SCSIO 43137 TaxID=3021011 RepID=UPI00230728ED|nr:GGDEF domain-containing protein [Vibrio sp. SCSIO 43137]WCE30989.1 GGDEF domain-containing protein [Vibrio sp. SCSIO 43137]
MKSFIWDKNFETGIKEVDEQHLYLVELVNRYGELITENDFSIEDAKSALKELSAYTSYHFRNEEMMMKRAGISRQHYDEHCETHQKFVRDIEEFADAVSHDSVNLSASLRDFLVQWLVYHILGSDQNMARQVRAIEAGKDADTAFEDGEREHDGAIGPLIKSLKGMFEQLSQRNKELLLLNQSLEDKVKQRTQELSLANEKLKQLSYTDTLTQLPNRRFAMKEIAKQWQYSTSSGAGLICMLIDVDKFKLVNDTCGHDAGDELLIEIATRLKENFRKEDMVCRLGGDEFLVICPELDMHQGLLLAAKMHNEMQKIRMEFDEFCWQGSISVGVSSIGQGVETVEQLIKLSDESVYLAKNAGKNCIRAIQE